MTQVVEADVRQSILSQNALDLLGDLTLVNVGADASREDYAMFLPAITRQELIVFLPLAVYFQHGTLA